MSNDEQMPSLRGDLEFEYDSFNREILMTMRYWQKGNRWNEEATEVKYARREGRWRWPDNAWRFVSFHAIASTLFDYRDIPTENEMYWMGDFVRDIGLILDSAQRAIQKGVADELAKREEARRRIFEKGTNNPDIEEVIHPAMLEINKGMEP